MRSSRVSSSTTSRFFATSSDAPSSPPTMGRITRNSLSSFAYRERENTPPRPVRVKAEPTSSPPQMPVADIEDILRPRATRKRKRTATTTTVTSARRVKKEDDDETSAELASTIATIKTEIKTEATINTSSPRKKKPTTPSAPIPIPANYTKIWPLLQQMRSPGGAAYPAAVDTMGCAALAAPTSSPRDRRFQTLVALMLSSQTKDETTAAAIAKLQTLPPYIKGVPPGLTLENVLTAPREVFHECIAKVGFHNTKTENILKTAHILREKWGSDIPDTIDGLVSLPGVGPKMAHLTMSAENGWGKVLGIGVDVHVHRIANMWGWTGKPTRNPEETRIVLEGWLPRERWGEINGLLVGLGQAVCKSVGKRCGDCEIGLAGGLCKAAERAKVNEGRRVRGMVKDEDGEWLKA